MRITLSTLATVLLLASPAMAGGDWYDWDDWGDRHRWHGSYRTYYGAPVYVPRVYAVPYAIPYPYYFDDDDDGDCEIERKWRHGRLIETIDCDD